MNNLAILRPGKLGFTGPLTTFKQGESLYQWGLDAQVFSDQVRGYALTFLKQEFQADKAGPKKLDFGSWRDYCAKRWNLDHRTCNRLIKAAPVLDKVTDELATAGPGGAGLDLTPSEGALRPLVSAPDEVQAPVIEKVVKHAKKTGKMPTRTETEEMVKSEISDAVIVEEKPAKKQPTPKQKKQFEAVRNFVMNTSGGQKAIAKYFLATLEFKNAAQVCEDLEIKVK